MEPNPEKQYIFYDFAEAFNFYISLLEGDELSSEQKSLLQGPRQSHGGTWLIDKFEDTEWQ
jgi:hypothetical protein